MSPSDSEPVGPAPRAFLERLFESAVGAARASVCLPAHLPPPPPEGRLIVIGAGKAAADMARVTARHYGDRIETGLVITRYGYALPGTAPIRVVESGHPTPDTAGVEATREVLALLDDLTEKDTVVCLISGGGSALMVAPAGPLSLADKQAVGGALMAAGAPIEDINCVRRHLSAVKGGRLAERAAPARLHTLIISDVTGDSLHDIASGPTVPDPTSRNDALALLERYGIDVPEKVGDWLARPEAETPKPGDPAFEMVSNTIAANAAGALKAAAETAQASGVGVTDLGEIAGDAQSVADAHAGAVRGGGRPGNPRVILSGGELTVAHGAGGGMGGPNSEYALALAMALDGMPGVYALAADTDGTDGIGGHAGAVIDPTTLSRAAAEGLDPADFLARHDSYNFFKPLGDLLEPGATYTNVNDFRAILVMPETE